MQIKRVYFSKDCQFTCRTGGKREMSTNIYKTTLLQRHKTTLGIRFIGILLIVAQMVPLCFVEAYFPANQQSTGKGNRAHYFSSTLHGSRTAQGKSGKTRTRLRLNHLIVLPLMYIFQIKRGSTCIKI